MIGKADHPFAKRRQVFPPRDGRAFRMLVVVDEFSRECLAILVTRRLNSDDVLALLTELFVVHGPPDHIRSPSHRLLCNRLSGKGAMGRSSAPTPFEIGSNGWMSARCSSSPAVPGRTAAARASTASSVTSS